MWSFWGSLSAELNYSTAFALLVSAFVGYKALAHLLLQAKLKHLPRPASTLPVLGNALDVGRKHRDRVHDWFLDESLRHEGKAWLLQIVGRPPSVILTQESHFEDVLKNQFDRFEKGAHIREFIVDFFGENGIFALDGAAWRHQRKTASHLFSHHMLRETMGQAIADDTRIVLRKLTKLHASNTPIELKLLMDALTTDVFTKIGFGVSLDCLDEGDTNDPQTTPTSATSSKKNDFDADFHRAFSRCPMVIQSRSQQPTFLWKLKRWLHVGEEKQLATDMKRINSAIFKVIDDSMGRFRRGDSANRKQQDLISLFLSKTNTEPGAEETTPELIRDMALNFIAAGRGTTGQSLAWFVIMMNRYPAVHHKVVQELERELPQLFDSTEANAVPSMEDVAQLTYLEAVIKESLRLNPAAPMNARIANQDTVLSDGTFIPKGVRVIIPTYATARLPWIWGPDAAEFKPERWIDETSGKIKQISPFKFLVFHAGPRICLGIKLAMLEMKIALAAMLSKFAFVTERDPFEISYDMSLSLPISGELFATVRPVERAKSRSIEGGMTSGAGELAPVA